MISNNQLLVMKSLAQIIQSPVQDVPTVSHQILYIKKHITGIIE